MSASIPPHDLTAEQLELWQRVDELWALSAKKDVARIRDALHPEYMGWDMSAPLYGGSVGVVHYRYQATVEPQGGSPMQVTGRWTEIYTKQKSRWLMVAVSGQPSASGGISGPSSRAA